MSVEEAWYTVEARIRAEAGADSIREARERLFREVRAEMPVPDSTSSTADAAIADLRNLLAIASANNSSP